jgi:hypothetical protein
MNKRKLVETRISNNMKKLVSLVEDMAEPVRHFGDDWNIPRDRDFVTTLNRVWHNARVLQSDIDYLNVSPGLRTGLKNGMKSVMNLLDGLHKRASSKA